MELFRHNGKHPHPAYKSKLTLSQRASDALAKFIGSWKFMILLISIIISWMVMNVLMLFLSWDPYPFILLNLTLSCLAALHTPVILMSQNRQEERDRITSRYDYLVDRKAEREIERVHKELDEIKIIMEAKLKKGRK